MSRSFFAQNQYPVPPYRPGAAYVGTEKVIDRRASDEVECPQPPITAAHFRPADPAAPRSNTMTLTLKTLSRNGKQAYYSGAAQIVRFPLGAFPDRQAPASIDVDNGIFAEARQSKVKETKEERKIRLAAAPKPTLAEKIARREAQLAKLKAQAEAVEL